jgi:hypothetical protein
MTLLHIIGQLVSLSVSQSVSQSVSLDKYSFIYFGDDGKRIKCVAELILGIEFCIFINKIK